MKILIMGLPGSGKTTLATALSKQLNCVHFNADDIRQNINRDLGFDHESRLEQARRMSYLCDIVLRSQSYVVADFVCPTPETRKVFGSDFTIWMDTIKSGRFDDTNKMFIEPHFLWVHYRIRSFELPTHEHVNKLSNMILNKF